VPIPSGIGTFVFGKDLDSIARYGKKQTSTYLDYVTY
jgi:hypothetical protein